jgi:energy-converting hydrogenase Eha subunit G
MMNRGDVRHDFALFWVCLVVIWAVFMGLAAAAHASESLNELDNSSELENYSEYMGQLNNTSSETLEVSNIVYAGSWLGSFFQFFFLPEIAVISLMLAAIGVMFGIYMVITLIAPGG